MRIKDLFYLKAGSTISHHEASSNCSYPCHEVSSKMVSFDTYLPHGNGKESKVAQKCQAAFRFDFSTLLDTSKILALTIHCIV